MEYMQETTKRCQWLDALGEMRAYRRQDLGGVREGRNIIREAGQFFTAPANILDDHGCLIIVKDDAKYVPLLEIDVLVESSGQELGSNIRSIDIGHWERDRLCLFRRRRSGPRTGRDTTRAGSRGG